MEFRCLLFTADPAAAEVVSQALAGIGVAAQHCSEAGEALKQAEQEVFQIAIIDWDFQPDAGRLLAAGRQRKPAERPLALALVSEDGDVPRALQAGANSILRKPILLTQAKDTLKTARDLLRARQEATHATLPKTSSAALPASVTGTEANLRAGEFLVVPTSAPGGEFITETEIPTLLDESTAIPVDPLRELEPVAATVQTPEVPEEAPQDSDDKKRGLEWYLKMRGGRGFQAPAQAGTGTAAAVASAPEPPKPELVSYEHPPSATTTSFQIASVSPSDVPETRSTNAGSSTPIQPLFRQSVDKVEESANRYLPQESSGETRGAGFHLGRGTVAAAVILAAMAIALAPQAPWHGKVLSASSMAQRALHAWLNPQPVAPAQAPATHENFAQAGDEYKLPVAENIPDATTDPSQIKVEPVIDPTAKKANDASSQAGGDQAPADAASTGDRAQPSATPAQENPPQPGASGNSVSGSGSGTSAGTAPAPQPAIVAIPTPTIPVPRPTIPTASQLHYVPASSPSGANSGVSIPSSLKSQMASMTPEASGNKPVEAALPTIEPVAVPESTERGLLAQQPSIAYPAGINGQQGTVALQVLIGRDGSVQDAKFLQGSLVFARTAIEGVKQWKFKPYVMNGRPVSVQTTLTVGFKPGS